MRRRVITSYSIHYTKLYEGLVRLSETEWLQAAPDLAPRAAAFDAHPDAVQVLPEARAAEAELARLSPLRAVRQDVRPAGLQRCRITSYNVCYTKLLRVGARLERLISATD